MKRSLLIPIVLTVLGLLAWLGRTLLFEKVTVEVNKELTGEAASNPFFAVRELYRGMGVDARTLDGLSTLPPHDQTLLLALESHPLLQKDVDRLWRWTAEGGHLVVATESPVASPFVERFGILSFDEGGADEDDHESRSLFETTRADWPKLYVEGGGPLLRSDGAEDAAWLLSVAEGEGTLTVVVSFAPLLNTELGERQNAELAWWLLQDREDRQPAGVWIVQRDPPGSVWALLASRARPLVLALVILCAAGLALLSRPFGPRLAPPPKDRRHLSEHLRATGRFLWRRQVEHVLLAAVQQGLRDRLAQGGELDLKQLHTLATRLAEKARRSGSTASPAALEAKEIRQAMVLPSTRDRQQFTRTIRVLEQLRRSA